MVQSLSWQNALVLPRTSCAGCAAEQKYFAIESAEVVLPGSCRSRRQDPGNAKPLQTTPKCHQQLRDSHNVVPGMYLCQFDAVRHHAIVFCHSATVAALQESAAHRVDSLTMGACPSSCDLEFCGTVRTMSEVHPC